MDVTWVTGVVLLHLILIVVAASLLYGVFDSGGSTDEETHRRIFFVFINTLVFVSE